MSKRQNILFLCNLNAVRSPMAEYIANNMQLSNLRFYSAGIQNVDELDYFAAFVMEEIGIDIKNHKSKSFMDITQQNFTKIICLSKDCEIYLDDIAKQLGNAEIIKWDIQSPADITGSREQRLQYYRQIRDDILANIKLI